MEIESNVDTCYKKIALHLAEFLLDANFKPVILCVGCDRVTGDSLAPMVGEMLVKQYNIPTFVYGGLTFNVTAQNIDDTINKINLWHPNSPIIVIDATVGESSDVGKIKYYKGGCYPAGVFSKKYLKVGDYSLLGVVECKGVSKLNFLHSVNLKIVTDLAHIIAKSIACAFRFSSVLTPIW